MGEDAGKKVPISHTSSRGETTGGPGENASSGVSSMCPHIGSYIRTHTLVATKKAVVLRNIFLNQPDIRALRSRLRPDKIVHKLSAGGNVFLFPHHHHHHHRFSFSVILLLLEETMTKLRQDVKEKEKFSPERDPVMRIIPFSANDVFRHPNLMVTPAEN
ncbi:hypothetical protein RUM44_001093 [Polyplax serrata]|uniref:Uncharacterized protein n=1 Tax=Polyplax serrata TaxID=468196 RepID=A0ABR1B9K8_POLSC